MAKRFNPIAAIPDFVELEILQLLEREGGSRPREIREKVSFCQTRSLVVLRRKGLISISRVPVEGRGTGEIQRCWMTPRGKKLLQAWMRAQPHILEMAEAYK